MRQRDPLIAWARQHRRLSTGTIRRRFRVAPEQAAGMIGELLAARVLHPEREGDSYRVRYPKPTTMKP